MTRRLTELGERRSFRQVIRIRKWEFENSIRFVQKFSALNEKLSSVLRHRRGALRVAAMLSRPSFEEQCARLSAFCASATEIRTKLGHAAGQRTTTPHRSRESFGTSNVVTSQPPMAGPQSAKAFFLADTFAAMLALHSTRSFPGVKRQRRPRIAQCSQSPAFISQFRPTAVERGRVSMGEIRRTNQIGDVVPR